MTILPIVLFAVVGAFLIMVLREIAPQVAFLLSLVIAVLLFIVALHQVTGVLAPLEKLAASANVNLVFFATVVKIIGIAYVVEFGAQIARDAGVGSIASKVELVGKLLIVLLALPIVNAVIDAVTHLLP
ncbi:stage III sporulation protein AD [Ferroacidibacillus organovorans]|uniref:Stage III sporulation protein AD n=1 Tax=Ferroacidibacillus organovorans TaxID=1765683 RepID=A0A101XSR7_9BACL|nr:stage III sporulation protein AD [Ferroacidibacillus organovorans]KUO96776.1 stage III sporulation protein AD [Ferroacidibacillus organovorans]